MDENRKEVLRLNRMMGKYSGDISRISEELKELSKEIMYDEADRECDEKYTRLVDICVSLNNLIMSDVTVEDIRINEIYDDLEEWLNENG